jgi:hypothetical protein
MALPGGVPRRPPPRRRRPRARASSAACAIANNWVSSAKGGPRRLDFWATRAPRASARRGRRLRARRRAPQAVAGLSFKGRGGGGRQAGAAARRGGRRSKAGQIGQHKGIQARTRAAHKAATGKDGGFERNHNGGRARAEGVWIGDGGDAGDGARGWNRPGEGPGRVRRPDWGASVGSVRRERRLQTSARAPPRPRPRGGSIAGRKERGEARPEGALGRRRPYRRRVQVGRSATWRGCLQERAAGEVPKRDVAAVAGDGLK